MTLEHFDSILAFVLIITGVSLLITTLTQMVSALLGLRGTHLRWGIKTLLANLDPSLKAHAEEISEQVLQHALISDSAFSKMDHVLFSRWRLASAIRQDELVAILRILANPPNPPVAGAATPAWVPPLQKLLEELNPQATDDIAKVATELKKLFPDDLAKARALLTPILDSSSGLTSKIDQWFDSVMDRSAQRFALHLRAWTVIFAVIVAFGLQLDAFGLFTRLSSDAEMRGQVISSANTLMALANNLTPAATNSSYTLYVAAMQQLIANHKTELKGLDEPAGFTTLADGKAWLATELEKRNIRNSDHQWEQAFADQVTQTPLQATAENLNKLLADKLILQLLPEPYPVPIYKNWAPNSRAFWGLLASAALLSLGAPFWFNALKNLSNLQPVVAKKEHQESAAES